MKEAVIEMAKQWKENTLGRSVPVKIVTDVEDGRTSEDGSLKSVWNTHTTYPLAMSSTKDISNGKQVIQK